MSKVRSLHNYSAAERDAALIGDISDLVMRLKEVPVEDLVQLRIGVCSAQLLLWGASQVLQGKLIELEAYHRAQRFQRDLIENGRPRNG